LRYSPVRQDEFGIVAQHMNPDKSGIRLPVILPFSVLPTDLGIVDVTILHFIDYMSYLLGKLHSGEVQSGDIRSL
jgi:hypothetical protein